MEIKAGDKVEILERGEWVGPFKVSDKAGRTPEHVVLEGPSGSFEHYADAPFNIRIFDYSKGKAVEISSERIEFLAQFSDYALESMVNGGYRTDDDELHTATREEVDAVEAHREANYQKWLVNNPVAELESYTEGPEVIDTVVLRVFGGSSAPARAAKAHDALEDFTANETKPVVTNAYECKAKVSESGTPYVEFTFSSIDFSNPNN